MTSPPSCRGSSPRWRRRDGSSPNPGPRRGGRLRRPPPAPISDEFVDQVLEHLLAAAGVLGGVALREDVGLEVGEVGLSALDSPTEFAIPTPVSFLDERGEPAVG